MLLFLFFVFLLTLFSCPLEGEEYPIRNKSYVVKLLLVFTNSPSSEGKQLPMIDLEVLDVIVVDED